MYPMLISASETGHRPVNMKKKMILDIVVKKTDDGYTAEIPGLKGCESWAHDEDTVMEKITELAAYYLKINSKDKFKIDRARTGKNKIIYKLVFNKN